MVALLDRVSRALDPDRGLQLAMSGLIEAQGTRYALGTDRAAWCPGQPLKLLLAGYVGTRNTGADVRVEEMIRQFRRILGDDQVELTLLTVDPALSAGYFRAVRQVQLPTVFPKFLYDECPRHHGVVACEGSMFKSKFATALSTMMAGALGLAAVEGKLSVGYGAEAGEMVEGLREFVRRQCKNSFVICRNEPSRRVLEALGIRTAGGTDTAWTFEPSARERGANLLEKAGWDGRSELLAICPINPFMWPTKPDVMKFLALRFAGQYREQHYKSIYFHHDSPEARLQLDAYLGAIAAAVGVFAKERGVVPVLVGMERLDRKACALLRERLGFRAPMFVSDEYDMYDLVSVLRNCSLMVTSRYHAMVTSMPGLVASAGITMDERIHNLLHDRGHPELLLRTGEEGLGEKLIETLRRLDRERARYREEIARFVPTQLRLMGQMGMAFCDEVSRVYPDFELPARTRAWPDYLPSLGSSMSGLLEQWG
ncbi:MAG: polysaccharide pyruvyl transferase family protein [Proteobacteria bacterium]|nr:polysaccharide pyruvyl transferase family protein [Pseudomonadota bacterium]